MKKHIIGFTLFSIIVGTAAFVYAMFNVVNVEEVFAPAYTPTYQGKSCWKMKRDLKESNVGSPVIRQAVLDLRTKQLNWELTAPQTNSKIALHFFVKDEDGTRYINSVIAPESGFENGVIKATSSYLWLDNLDSYENLYVIAEFTSWSNYKNKNNQPKFDPAKATSVLLYSGEQGYLTEKFFRE